MLSLIGYSARSLELPQFTLDTPQNINYNASYSTTQGEFTSFSTVTGVNQASPQPSYSIPTASQDPLGVQLQFLVNKSDGSLGGHNPTGGDDLDVYGTVTINGTLYVGTTTPLLRGTISQFGFDNVHGASFDFGFVVIGGLLDNATTGFAGQTLGMELGINPADSPAANPFGASFSGSPKGVMGPAKGTPSPAVPSITTNTGPMVALGSGGLLTDSATLSGGNIPSGSITFNLFAPNDPTYSSPVFTQTININGDGTYGPTSGYLPTMAGTYEWVATYSGDVNNISVNSGQGNEPETVTQVTPSINTVAAPTVVIGSGVALNDTAVLSSGYNPTGSITFKLYDAGSNVIYTDNVTVSGNGTYTTLAGDNPGGFIPTSTGPYLWGATYNGDGNNATATDNGQNESATVTPTSPAINTVAGGTVVIGSGTNLTDTAVLSGGYMPTGTITFTLTYNNTLVVDTETVNVNGDNTYSTPTGYLPTATGSYVWSASYSGDLNNSSATDNGQNETEVVSPASPAINTVAGNTVVIGDGVPLTDTANLTGGYNPTGTITFTLTGPGGVLDTETVPVLGDNTYGTPSGYVPTEAGTYVWSATYSGDSNNNGATDNGQNESQTVSHASPNISTVASGNQIIGNGTNLMDTALLSDGYNPTGTITFMLYGPGNTLVYTDTVIANGNGSYSTAGGDNPGGYLPTATGSYLWVASYSGDANNNSATDNGQNESETVTPATPSINTTQQPAVAIVGSAVADQATVSGGYNPTGTVTFNLYSNPNGTGTPLFTDTESLVGGVATSASYTTTATATDYWVATYNGDSNNNPVTSGVADEPVIVNVAIPQINTSQQPASAVVGSSVADQATVSGGYNPSGTVTFNLYSNPNGTGTPLFTDTEALVGGTATSAGYTATATGNDYWVATYNGDSNNQSVTSGTADEPVIISTATPSVDTTQQPASAVVGSSIADKATVSGGFNPTGTVTFNLYSSATVQNSSTLLFSDTELLSGGMATSAGYTATATGTDYWVATYNGDSNNNAVTSTATSEPVVITTSTPGITTTPSAITTTSVGAGQFATIGFWHNQNGQAVINSFNGSSSSTALGNWMASNWPNLFGASNPYTGTSLAGLTNAQVATVYSNLWTPNGVTKNTYVQTFAVALGLYADTTSLGGQSLINNGLASTYGFVVTASGAGTFNVGSNGSTFGVANNTSLTVQQILQILNSNFNPSTGNFFGGDSTNTGNANNVTNGINSTGDIPGGGTLTGSGSTLIDSATLSGGVNPTGTITFYLFAPGVTPNGNYSNNVYTDTVTVSGDGTYTVLSGNSPGGYAPGASGTYQWVAVYSGDSSNGSVTSPFGSEPWTVGQAAPSINTIPGNSVVLGSGAKLTDSASLAGGSNPTGTITFTLYSPSNAIVYTDTVTVSGNGNYSTATGNNPGGYLPTATGTYEWVASYSGDANNGAYTGTKGDEPETVTASLTGSISGTKYEDITGNGFSSDDYSDPLSGVTIDLLNSSGKIIATQKTDSNGNYDFTGLSAGSYTVKEVVPSGYVETGPTSNSGTYPITLTSSNLNSSGNNFDDFQADCDLSDFSCVTFCIQDASGVKTVTDLRGNTNQGDEVTVFFNYSGEANHPVTLVSYTAPDNYWNPNDAGEQQIFQSVTILAQHGENSITVQIPNCDYQIDFVCGYAIDQLGPNGSNITYSSQGRLISADNDGKNAQASTFGQINGNVYLDLNNNGKFESNEVGIGGVELLLTGKDNQGDAVSMLRITNPDGSYSFQGLQPGTYSIKEVSPSGFIDGMDMLGTGVGGTKSNDLFSNLKVTAPSGLDGENYNFGELPGKACTGVSGCVASCTFWNSTNGKNLICSFGGSSSDCTLGNWLAATCPNLYGSGCGSNCLAGKTNSQVYAYFQSLYKNSKCKAQCELLASCLNLYATDICLGGLCGAAYGFQIQQDGAACDTYSVGSNGSCFGVKNNTKCTLSDLIDACNSGSSKGSLFGGNSSKGNSCYTVLSGINGW